MRFHSFAPNLDTAARSASSSSGVHRPGPDPCRRTGANGSLPSPPFVLLRGFFFTFVLPDALADDFLFFPLARLVDG